MNILITGAAGFIGSSLLMKLAARGDKVVGVDNLNNYYDARLKLARLAECKSAVDFEFLCIDIADHDAMQGLFDSHDFDVVVNLAAQAGVRYSIEKPYAYQHSNLDGFLSVLEQCRHHGVKHLVFASSSSVYGQDSKVPFREEDTVDSPVSLYAATKKTDELMAYTYCHLYGLRTTGLRYFTVYGPWGRPDMAPMLFAKAIMNGEEIKVFNNGNMARDFTFIDDIVEGTMRVIDATNAATPHPYRIYNIGCGHPVRLLDFIGELEQAFGRKATMRFLPMQPGDVYLTYADTTRLQQELGYRPKVELHEGIGRFAEWYLSDKNPLR
jgi:UDP-glucuronate 4-epimerase